MWVWSKVVEERRLAEEPERPGSAATATGSRFERGAPPAK